MTADFDTIRAALADYDAPGTVGQTSVMAALARVEAAAEQAEKEAEKILPADEVCACLDETGGRQVRIYERCERCHALMESDLAEQLAEQSESADEWREQWERAKQRAEQAESAAKDAQMKERALTDYFADASRRADEWQERAEQAERERDELIRNGLTDLTETARQLERSEAWAAELEADNRAMQQEADEMEARVEQAEKALCEIVMAEPLEVDGRTMWPSFSGELQNKAFVALSLLRGKDTG